MYIQAHKNVQKFANSYVMKQYNENNLEYSF